MVLTCICDGNMYVDCWDCHGSGTVFIPEDDMTDIPVECLTCGGEGGWKCPGHGDSEAEIMEE